ncbi:MAG TPA: isochorismatase family protein [Chthoniobacterales bacterium]|nr:isochorismatase family protein [Chthoniobacterales bacterium]
MSSRKLCDQPDSKTGTFWLPSATGVRSQAHRSRPELRSRGIDTVVLTGISTNGGVESTLRQGTGLGFAFVVVENACSGQDAEEHRFAFERIFPRLARVRTVEEVMKALA